MQELNISSVLSVAQLLESAPECTLIFKADQTTHILYSNHKMWQLFGCDNEADFMSFCNGNYMNLIAPEDRGGMYEMVHQVRTNRLQKSHRTSFQIVDVNGKRIEVEDYGNAIDIGDFGEAVICFFSCGKDSSQFLYETNDKLTGLFRMKPFLSYAEEVLRRADGRGDFADYAFVYCNIRNFKYYNVRHGMQEGNKVLLELSEVIRASGPEDLIARFSNDHFVSLIKKNKEDVLKVAQEVIDHFHQKFASYGMKLKVGIFFVRKKGESPATACDLAKVACDTIRQAQDEICVYDDRLKHNVEMSSYVIQNIDDAIQNGHIKVYYQPVVRTVNNALCGMEALARWESPQYGFLSPADFIPALEENRLITKLDLYVLSEICREMKDAEEKNLPLVPISFNLSRHDFLDCDIFQEVENIVMKYKVARDMINIEITESTVMEDPEILKQEMERFRAGGYQVWMDDFGSGYSSLNVLKDYHFDEIKLDMKFLSTFDARSKTIIKSIVSMAKQLGVQTLAEGVETKEQLDFLREVGCEKVQGYFFSKPLPLPKLRTIGVENRIKVEQRAWKNYYNSISAVDVITDRPLAIMEYDGENFTCLYLNQNVKQVWESLGAVNMEIVYESINSGISPLSKQFRDVQMNLQPEDAPREIVCSVRGQYVRLMAKCLARHGVHAAFLVENTNLSGSEAEKKREQLDNVFRMMYALYDSIYLLHLDTKHFETLMKGASYSRLSEANVFYEKSRIDPTMAARLFIHPNDCQEYASFTDQTTLTERLKKAERGYLTRYFRTRTANGAYVWKAHTMLYLSDMQVIVYCTRHAYFSQSGLIERVAPEYLIDSMKGFEQGFHRVLRQGLMQSRMLNLFWKDRDRRFIGANERFLETYGFDDVSVLIGKTDEEMGWHIDDDPFRNDEIDVLTRGTIISNRIGRCIIKGVAHNILVSKEPLYEDGKIVGLLGFFVIIDDLNENRGAVDAISVMDPLTGLMSSNGMANVVGEFADSWSTQRKNFAVIRIGVPEYQRAVQTYGEQIAKQMLYEIGQMISDVFKSDGSCARLYAGNFVVLMKCEDKAVVRRFVAAIEKRLQNVHCLAGYAATVSPEISLYFADEAGALHEIVGLALGSTAG